MIQATSEHNVVELIDLIRHWWRWRAMDKRIWGRKPVKATSLRDCIIKEICMLHSPAGYYTPAVIQLFANLANLTLRLIEGNLSFFVLILYKRSHYLQFLHAKTLVLHFYCIGVLAQSSQIEPLVVYVLANFFCSIGVELWHPIHRSLHNRAGMDIESLHIHSTPSVS